jgi:hypothetical protein
MSLRVKVSRAAISGAPGMSFQHLAAGTGATSTSGHVPQPLVALEDVVV